MSTLKTKRLQQEQARKAAALLEPFTASNAVIVMMIQTDPLTPQNVVSHFAQNQPRPK